MTEHVCPAEIPDEITEAVPATIALQRAPAARLPRHQPLRLPLGRRAGRRGAVPARDQHPAGDDPAQPGARAGAAHAGSTTPSWSRRSSPRRWPTSAEPERGGMMAQTIKRKAPSASQGRRRAGQRAQGAQGARRSTGSALDRADGAAAVHRGAAAQGVPRADPRRRGGAGVVRRQPRRACPRWRRQQVAALAADAGFEVRRVEVAGSSG